MHRARVGSFAERLQVPADLAYPTAHLGLRWAELSARDVDDVMALYERCRSYDRSDAVLTADRVRLYVESADTDDRHHAIVGWDTHGEMRAFGIVTALGGCTSVLRSQVRAFIDPTWRGRGIGRALLDWQDGRARQMLAEDGRDLPVSMEARVDSHNTERRRLLAAAGFTPTRTIDELVRTVRPDTYITAVTTARLEEAGVQILPFDHSLAEDVRQVYNRNLDVSGGRVITEKDFHRRVAEIDETLSFIAVTTGVEPLVVGCILAGRKYGGEGAWIEFMAAERAWRQHGIPEALIAYHLTACADEDMKLSSVEVDTAHSAQATAVLNSLDYFSSSTDILYSIEV